MARVAGQMSYSVKLSKSEALIEQHIADMLRMMGTLNGDNIITFLHAYGKFCKTKSVSHGAAEERLWTIMMPGVRAQVEKTFTEGGPVMTDTTVIAPLDYMGGEWTAVEKSTTQFGIGYESAVNPNSSQKKWCRKSVFEQGGSVQQPQRRGYLTPNTPATTARKQLEREQSQRDSVAVSLSDSFRDVADEDVEVVIPPANMRQAAAVADIGAGELARPVGEQRYLVVAVAWAVALGATGAKYAILERINTILKSTEMAWQAVGWELDKLREQLPLAVLIDEFASKPTAAARWDFVSKWRIREQGELYREHEAMLARALLAQAPQKHMEKAMDQGMLAGNRPRDYKTLRAYFLTLAGRDSRVNVFRPRQANSGTVSVVNRMVRGRSMDEWATAATEPTESQTEPVQPAKPMVTAHQGDQITGMLAALHRSEAEKATLKGELHRIKETRDKQKRNVDREVQMRTAGLLEECQSP